MKKLEGRIIALESRRGDQLLAHLSDTELTTQLIGVCEEIELLDRSFDPEWRNHIAAGAFRRIIASIPCAA
ncbi:hypothetical protein [Pelagerythrobacter sp.]|uniref:hypothetical protein n=1 Tax=Pelagerythrobacter sp. TaxID=2800702 RepID=UPI0035B20368